MQSFVQSFVQSLRTQSFVQSFVQSFAQSFVQSLRRASRRASVHRASCRASRRASVRKASCRASCRRVANLRLAMVVRARASVRGAVGWCCPETPPVKIFHDTTTVSPRPRCAAVHTSLRLLWQSIGTILMERRQLSARFPGSTAWRCRGRFFGRQLYSRVQHACLSRPLPQFSSSFPLPGLKACGFPQAVSCYH